MMENAEEKYVSHRPDSIQEALKILDDALAGKSGELSEMIGEEFHNLRQALSETGGHAAESLRTTADTVTKSVQQGMGYVDHVVRENPWAVIAGVAAGTFAVGVILGQRGRESEVQ